MTLPLTLPAYERAAREILPPDVSAYLFGGAGSEATLAANLSALERMRLVPRAFGEARDLAVTIFGQRYAAPLLVAPMGWQNLFHPDGEVGTARAAAALGLGYIAPMLASMPCRRIRAAAEGAPQWFQLYIQPRRDLTLRLLNEAEAAGFSALVVTVDAPVDGVRDRQIEAGFRAPSPEPDTQERVAAGADSQFRFVPSWNDLAWLRGMTRLPLVVKGLMSAEDALQALELGADGIIVSNHGGRVLDGAISSVEALAAVSDAVASRIPVLFDSGIRRGVDIAKALRLGATAVLVGRPVACGLCVGGDRGAAHVLKMLVEELQVADLLSGAAMMRRRA